MSLEKTYSTAKSCRNLRHKVKLDIKHLNLRHYMVPDQKRPQFELLSLVSKTLAGRRRRASENLRHYDYIGVFKDRSVTQRFQSFFTLGKKIGEGAQSVVYECVEKETQKNYVVKVCKSADIDMLEDMRVSYQIMRKLDHPTIIKGEYLYLNERELTCHIVMEHFDHPELRSYINRSRVNPQLREEKKVVKIIYLLLRSLCHMAQNGVCHRDLKPENVLFDEANERIKVIDFELSRIQRYSHQKLELWSRCGTVAYRAPETFKGAYGIPVDVWSVGLIAFELLTGEMPFRSPFQQTLIKDICTKKINYKDYNLSPAAINFLKRLLDRSPEHRTTPKEALSSPFILKNLNQNTLVFSTDLKQQLSFNQKKCSPETEDESLDNISHKQCYNDTNIHCFTDTLNKDVGVRRYESRIENPERRKWSDSILQSHLSRVVD